MQTFTPPLDEDLNESSENTTPVPAETLRHWQGLHQWARFLAYLNFASVAVQLISFFVVYPAVRQVFRFTDIGSDISIIMIVFFLLSITFTTLIGWQLLRYGAHLKSALFFSQEWELDLSFYYLHRYFRLLGWMTIGIIAIVLLSIALALSSDLGRLLLNS